MNVTFIDLFSGIGGFHSGLEKAGMRCIGWCEFDKFAQKSYRAMYDTKGLWFSDDIRTTKGDELPRADMWTFGFPCQDISIAGKKGGIKQGTRSGLFYEVMRLIDECPKENKPKYLLIENVKNLLSIDKGRGFLSVLCEMAERGYNAEWKVYNSKDYGVPQNRERVYIVGYNGETSGRQLLPWPRKSGSTINQVGNLIDTLSFGGNHQSGLVYSSDGVSLTVNCMGGGGLELKVLTNFIDLSTKNVKITDNCRSLMAKYTAGITNHAAVNSGVLEVYNTETTGVNLGVLESENTIRIRKLTPRECWRLQGFTDEQFDRARAVNSNTQLYKQAGNAVTVNVTYEIGKHFMAIFEGELN